MGFAIVDGAKRLIDRVIKSERPEGPVDEATDDSWERQRGAELNRDYKDESPPKRGPRRIRVGGQRCV